MEPDPLTQFGIIIALATLGQWIASVLRLPSILLLLVFGFTAGPLLNVVKPDILFGESLFPIISFAVAIILFEGSLSLRLSRLAPVRWSVFSLTTIGLGITWGLSAMGAFYLFGFHLEVAFLFGAILIVTGPTVIVPLLRELSIDEDTETLAIWEGIVNDPVGAVLCVTTYEVIKAIGSHDAYMEGFLKLLVTLGLGGICSIVGTTLLVFSLARDWIPDYLKNTTVVGIVLFTFVAAEQVSAEAGLVAVTLMGFFVANQNMVPIEDITSFGEDLEIVLLSVLFIILAARFDLESFRAITYESYIFLGLLIFFIRPVSVFISSVWVDKIDWRDVVALSFLAPRGLVAAALSSLFALKLEGLGYPEARQIDSEIFFLICGTVLFYGLVSPRLLEYVGVTEDRTPPDAGD